MRRAVLVPAAALLVAACGTAHPRRPVPAGPVQSSGRLSLYASCAQWRLASAAEQRSFTEGLYGAGRAAAAGARGDISAAELRLLIAVHCGDAGAAGTPLGLIVIDAIVGTLEARSGRGG
jgi:hypothetical protein